MDSRRPTWPCRTIDCRRRALTHRRGWHVVTRGERARSAATGGPAGYHGFPARAALTCSSDNQRSAGTSLPPHVPQSALPDRCTGVCSRCTERSQTDTLQSSFRPHKIMLLSGGDDFCVSNIWDTLVLQRIGKVSVRAAALSALKLTNFQSLSFHRGHPAPALF